MTTLSPDQIQKQLQSDNLSDRQEAVEALGSSSSPLDSLADLLKVRDEDDSEELRNLASEKLRDLGAIIDLSPMGADMWFEQVKESSAAFETLCDVMGERFVGYALIVGVQISGLTIDQFTPANTLVEFKLVESAPPRTLRLPDFRRELINWILSETPEPPPIVLPLDLAQAQQIVGVRYILLAPLHDISLKEVILEKAGRKPEARVVVVSSDGSYKETSVDELQKQLNELVETELEATRDEPFELDFDLVDKANEAAEQSDWDEVLKLIGHWPGPLSMLSRMQMGSNLDDSKKDRIGSALELLAKAYRATGRSAWAEELYRLGLQFSNEGSQGASLYQALGEAMLEEKRYGESLGPLRRSLSLGADISEIGPSIGLALFKCRRYVAAAVIIEESLKKEADKAPTLPLLKKIYEMIGETAGSFRELHPSWISDDELKDVAPLTEENGSESDTLEQNATTLEIAMSDEFEDEDSATEEALD